jgi:hypothetical protein
MKWIRNFAMITALVLLAFSVTKAVWAQPVISSSIVPQYIQGRNGTNTQRIPVAYWVSISGLTANATYRYFNQVVRSSDSQTSSGAGNVIYAISGGFTRTSSPGLSTAGTYGEFTTDAGGVYNGWFITEPTGNARFVPGQFVFFRIMLNDGAGGTTVATRLTTPDSLRVLMLGTTTADSVGTGLRTHTQASPRDFVLLYDNTSGTGRPLAGTFLESDGTDNSTGNSYISFYADSVNLIDGAFGTIIPNLNGNGVRRVERRSATGEILAFNQSGTGIWPSGANTVNPTGGATAVVLIAADVPLTSGENSAPAITLVNRDPLSPAANIVVTVTALITDVDGSISSAAVFYDAGAGFLSLTMFDDGTHGDGEASDGRYGALLPGQPTATTVRYYVEATDNASATVRYPADAPDQVLRYLTDRTRPLLLINEFMAQNTHTIQDNHAEWADWIEIFNAGSETVQLEGIAMTDDYSDLQKWQFPDTTIPAGGVLLVWADEDVNDPEVHAGFKLSTSGEQIALCDLADYGGAVLDSISFGPQTADISYARQCDGGANWVFVGTPTPRASNGMCPPLSVTVSLIDNDVTLRWLPTPGASEYQVYRLFAPEDGLEQGDLVATVTEASVTLAGEAATHPRAFYTVVAARP